MSYKDLSPEHKKRLYSVVAYILGVGILFLGLCTFSLVSERYEAVYAWEGYFQDTDEDYARVSELSKNAVNVTVGTYVENLREVNLKMSNYRVEMLIWFKWKGDEQLNPAGNFRVYRGATNRKETVRQLTTEDGEHYQLVRLDTTISQNYQTKRFPLESHALMIYIESEIPVQSMVFEADREDSGINRYIAVTGYKFRRHDIGTVSYKYSTAHGDPTLEDYVLNSEIVTGLEINRDGLGIYFKCFIALMGTLLWTLIIFYLNVYHRFDPVSMIPGVLFGAVANIMVGASLLPDALDMGLLEYINGWGIYIILSSAIAIINLNRVREVSDDADAALYMGKLFFRMMVVLCLVGNFIFPVTAYLWNI